MRRESPYIARRASFTLVLKVISVLLCLFSGGKSLRATSACQLGIQRHTIAGQAGLLPMVQAMKSETVPTRRDHQRPIHCLELLLVGSYDAALLELIDANNDLEEQDAVQEWLWRDRLVRTVKMQVSETFRTLLFRCGAVW